LAICATKLKGPFAGNRGGRQFKPSSKTRLGRADGPTPKATVFDGIGSRKQGIEPVAFVFEGKNAKRRETKRGELFGPSAPGPLHPRFAAPFRPNGKPFRGFPDPGKRRSTGFYRLQGPYGRARAGQGPYPLCGKLVACFFWTSFSHLSGPVGGTPSAHVLARRGGMDFEEIRFSRRVRSKAGRGFWLNHSHPTLFFQQTPAPMVRFIRFLKKPG